MGQQQSGIEIAHPSRRRSISSVVRTNNRGTEGLHCGKKKMIDKIKPMSFISLEDFHQHVLRPGEPLSLKVHELKQLLTQAMLDISDQTSE